MRLLILMRRVHFCCVFKCTFRCLLQSHAARNAFSPQEIETRRPPCADDLHRAQICLNQAWTNSRLLKSSGVEDGSIRSDPRVGHTQKHNPLWIAFRRVPSRGCLELPKSISFSSTYCCWSTMGLPIWQLTIALQVRCYKVSVMKLPLSSN